MKYFEEIDNKTNGMSNEDALRVVNRAIQDAKTTDERLELLALKCMILEDAIFGDVFT